MSPDRAQARMIRLMDAMVACMGARDARALVMDAASYLSDIVRQGEPPARTMAEIAEDVASQHGMTAKEMMSSGRTSRLARARWHAMWEMRRSTNKAGVRHSLPQIGRFFGLDHTTVLHGVRRHEEILLTARRGIGEPSGRVS